MSVKKNVETKTDPGSCSLNLERHGLSMAIRDRECAFHVPGKWPWGAGELALAGDGHRTRISYALGKPRVEG